MVINATKDIIRVRMATVDESVPPPDVTQAYKEAPRTEEKNPSEFIVSGKLGRLHAADAEEAIADCDTVSFIKQSCRGLGGGGERPHQYDPYHDRC